MARNTRYDISLQSWEKISLHYLSTNICKGLKNTFCPALTTLQKTNTHCQTKIHRPITSTKKRNFKLSKRISRLHTQDPLHAKFHVKIYNLPCSIFLQNSRSNFNTSTSTRGHPYMDQHYRIRRLVSPASNTNWFSRKTCLRTPTVYTFSKTGDEAAHATTTRRKHESFPQHHFKFISEHFLFYNLP